MSTSDNFVMVGKPTVTHTVTVVGKLSKACSRADMLSMIAAADGKALKDSGKINRVSRCIYMSPGTASLIHSTFVNGFV